MIRRKSGTHSNHERWLVSYADFITLLFAFFVVLYASAQIDKKKVGQLSEAIEDAFQEMGAFPRSAIRSRDVSATPASSVEISRVLQALQEKGAGVHDADPRDMAQLNEELEHILAKEIERQEVSIYVGTDGLVLSLREVGFFDSGSAQIRAQAQQAFDRVMVVLTRKPYWLRIEGHTDNVPIHNTHFASNWELSTARATEVVRLLVTEHNFRPEDLSAAGYAEFHPAGDNATFAGRQMNRRVDIVILGTNTHSTGGTGR